MSEQNDQAVTLEHVQDLINTTVSGLAARQQKEFTKLLTPITEQLTGFASTVESLQQAPAPKPEEGTTQVDPRVSAMEKELKDLKAAREAEQAKAAKLERENALSKVLGGFQFANDVARETAFKNFISDLQVGSDGAFYIGDEPLDSAVKSRMAQLPGLLAPKPVNGSGATSGQTTPQGPLEVKSGMNKDEMQSVATRLLQSI